MGHIGFSYVGCLYLLMLFIPNMLWMRKLPKGYDASNENRILLFCERVGQVLVTVCAIIFTDFNIKAFTPNTLWLLASCLCMLLYEGYWVRYFKSERRLEDFYSSFCGVPLAGATLPVIAFFLLGVYGQVVYMMLSVLLLGIGHIGIHIQHKRELYK